MYVVVDSDWAKEHPRRAAKIQVAYLLWLARRRDQASGTKPDPCEESVARARHKILLKSPLGT
jgi:hypothetical protein